MPQPIDHRAPNSASLTRLCVAFALSALAIGSTALHAQTPGSDDAQPKMLNQRMSKFSRLPAVRPTTLDPVPTVATTPAPNTLPAPTAATPIGIDQPTTRSHRAEVTFAGGQLDVRANDSSLNQILRAISRETGLKITGGVADQRVFGNYGPSSIASIVATLLDGTGTNLLLLEGDSSTPPELVLTPRVGSPTPPSLSASADDDAPEPVQTPEPQTRTSEPQTLPVAPLQRMQTRQPEPSGPQPIPQPDNNINGSPDNTTQSASTIPTVQSVPTDSISTPSTAPSVSGIVDSTNPPAAGSTTGTQPAGALTPEQVYQQLLQQQQKQKPVVATPQQ